MNLIDRVFEAIDLMKAAIAEAKERAVRRARAEAKYQSIKYKRAFEIRLRASQ